MTFHKHKADAKASHATKMKAMVPGADFEHPVDKAQRLAGGAPGLTTASSPPAPMAPEQEE